MVGCTRTLVHLKGIVFVLLMLRNGFGKGGDKNGAGDEYMVVVQSKGIVTVWWSYMIVVIGGEGNEWWW